MRKIAIIFFTAFVLNAIWENLHSLLYDNYMGGKITEFILLRASLFDALVISVIVLPFFFLSFLKDKSWLIILLGTTVAIFNEWFGLNTARWAYNSLMPIIPLINVGFTPAIQLGILGYVSYRIQEYVDLHTALS
ncbi:MAG: hypothetical protein WCT07_01750 [Candidatus Paceibacterota bacterium]|jgi:hypothetical protein